MSFKEKMLTLILISCTPLVFSQIMCDPVTKDLEQVLALAFKPVLKAKDSIVLRNNLKTVCVEKALDKRKVRVWNEQKLFSNLYRDYYYLEDIQIYEDFAKVVYIQRSNNLMFKLLFFKENNKWYPIGEQYKWQGRMKGDDFLLRKINEELRKE